MSDFGFKLIRRIYFKLSKKRLYTKKMEFINRQKGYDNLLIVLCGFQPFYWDVLFQRIKFNQDTWDEKLDVCLLVPKGEGKNDTLKTIAEKNGWSYMYLFEDLLAQGQNTAIKLHPSANYIFKIDEDIVLCKNFFANLKKAYQKSFDSYMHPGFIAPLINVNAFGFTRFVETIDKSEDFKRHGFNCSLGKDWEEADIHNNQKMAEVLWSYSLPFDEIADKVHSKNNGQIATCPHRFSIGAFMFERELWIKMGGFSVGSVGQLGLEEKQLCEYCMDRMYSINIALDTFVGHFGFRNQKETVRIFYENNKKKFEIMDNHRDFVAL